MIDGNMKRWRKLITIRHNMATMVVVLLMLIGVIVPLGGGREVFAAIDSDGSGGSVTEVGVTGEDIRRIFVDSLVENKNEKYYYTSGSGQTKTAYKSNLDEGKFREKLRQRVPEITDEILSQVVADARSALDRYNNAKGATDANLVAGGLSDRDKIAKEFGDSAAAKINESTGKDTTDLQKEGESYMECRSKNTDDEAVKECNRASPRVATCLSKAIDNDKNILGRSDLRNKAISDCAKSPGELYVEETNEESAIDECYQGVRTMAWTACPGLSLMEQMINSVLNAIANSLKWTILTDSNSAGAIRDSWEKIRVIANVLFVIVFMALLYSIATSTGLSNYTVKQILPTLIITAVAVNISFYICAALADLSNIAGQAVFNLIAGGVTRMADVKLSWGASALGIVAFAIIGLSMAGTVLMAVVAIFVAFQFRQTALVVLVVLSPLAFAMRLLPNTRKIWDKWWGMYSAMLVLYPIFMAMWAASMWCRSVLHGDMFVDLPLVIAPVFGIIPMIKNFGGIAGNVLTKAQKYGDKTPIAKYGNRAGSAGFRAMGRATGRKAAGGATWIANSAMGRSMPMVARSMHAAAKHMGSPAQDIQTKVIEDAKFGVQQMSHSDQMAIVRGEKAASSATVAAAIELNKDNIRPDDYGAVLDNVRQIANKSGGTQARAFRDSVKQSLSGKEDVLDVAVKNFVNGNNTYETTNANGDTVRMAMNGEQMMQQAATEYVEGNNFSEYTMAGAKSETLQVLGKYLDKPKNTTGYDNYARAVAAREKLRTTAAVASSAQNISLTAQLSGNNGANIGRISNMASWGAHQDASWAQGHVAQWKQQQLQQQLQQQQPVKKKRSWP